MTPCTFHWHDIPHSRRVSLSPHTQFRSMISVDNLVSTLVPGGVFGTVANVIKTVPCLAKESLDGGFLFGVGVDAGGPAVTIQCRRVSCYTCLAQSAFSVSPFGGLVAKAIEQFSGLLKAQAADVVRDAIQEYVELQQELMRLQEMDEAELAASMVPVPAVIENVVFVDSVVEDEDEDETEGAEVGFSPVATNSAWSVTSCVLFYFFH